MQGVAPATESFDPLRQLAGEAKFAETKPLGIGVGIGWAPETRDGSYVINTAEPAISDWSSHRARRVSILMRINRLLRAVLITFCGVTLLGYGLDVASSSEVAKLQEQARRLDEQNTELSAQLLRAISFQGIQANVVGHAGLRLPEHVIIVKDVQPPVVPPFSPNRYYLPLGVVGY
jgi:hypothetical protein